MGANLIIPTDWSPDGLHLLGGSADVRVASWKPGAKPEVRALVESAAFREGWARFSPDGKWFAYQSDEGGPYQVFVQPFPPTGAKWQVSSKGGYMAPELLEAK